MIKAGIIGTGTWGKNYVRAVSELDNVELAIIADSSEEKAREFSTKYNVKYTTDYMDILKDPEISAVFIVTPASTHYGIVKDALLAGKNVMVEKPLTLVPKECDELAEISEREGKVLMVGHIFRFHPSVNKLKEEIRKGTFGKVRFFYGSRMGLMTPRTDCGVIFDFALHDVDVFCYLLDELPSEVTCTGSFYSGNNLEDVGFITLGFGNSVVANVGVSWLTPKKVRDLWVVGEKKSGSIDYLSQEFTVYNKGIVPGYNSFGEFKLVKQEGEDVQVPVENVEPLKEEILHFLDCVKSGKKPKVDGRVGSQAVRIIEKCYESLKEKKTVKMH